MGRNVRIDNFRILAIFFVIAIHASPFKELEGDFYHFLAILIRQVSSYAVPFFFVISGYFFGKALLERPLEEVFKKKVKRLIGIFFLWSLIYLLPYDLISAFQLGISGPIKVVYWNLLGWLSSPERFFFQGPIVHLWFVAALIYAMFLATFLLFFNQEKILYFISIGLFIFGLLVKSYSDSPFGFQIEFNARNGPFFSAIFFSTGIYLSKFKEKSNWKLLGFSMMLGGLTLQIFECFLLNYYFSTTPYQDYYLGTYFFGLGVSLLSLTVGNSTLPITLAGKGYNYGKYTLGVYGIHYIFIEILSPLDFIFPNFAWHLIYPIIVFGLSLFFVIKISKTRIGKYIVL